MTYECPTCGRLTTKEGVCTGTRGEPHGARELVEAADAPDTPLALDMPIARVVGDEVGTRDLT